MLFLPAGVSAAAKREAPPPHAAGQASSSKRDAPHPQLPKSRPPSSMGVQQQPPSPPPLRRRKPPRHLRLSRAVVRLQTLNTNRQLAPSAPAAPHPTSRLDLLAGGRRHHAPARRLRQTLFFSLPARCTRELAVRAAKAPSTRAAKAQDHHVPARHLRQTLFFSLLARTARLKGRRRRRRR